MKKWSNDQKSKKTEEIIKHDIDSEILSDILISEKQVSL